MWWVHLCWLVEIFPKFNLLLTSSWITNFMEHSPSWEAYSSSASPKIAQILWKPNVDYLVYNITSHVPLSSQISLVHETHSIPWRFILNSSTYASVFQVVPLYQASTPKPSMHFSFPSHIIHVPAILFFSIWSPEWYLVNTNLNC
jgi:hypothetical protein